MDNAHRSVAPGLLRIAVGDALLALTAAFAVYIAIVMLRRSRAVVAGEVYAKVLRRELVLCAIPILLALDVRFDLFDRLRVGGSPLPGLLLRVAVTALTAALALLAAKVALGGLAVDDGPADAAIVLGLALEDGQAAPDLLRRLDTAASYARAHPDIPLIVTGGNRSGASRSEAEVMRDLLAERGVPAERVLLEDKAADTRENFLNAARMIDPARPAAVITSECHMGRAVRLAREAGFARVSRQPAPSQPLTYGANLLWEVLMELNHILFGR